MKKRYVSLILISLAILSSVFLFGCKHDTIKFYRESAASTMINKFAPQKSNVKVNSGIIILKDEVNQSNINFGPRDINFDMPHRFK